MIMQIESNRGSSRRNPQQARAAPNKEQKMTIIVAQQSIMVIGISCIQQIIHKWANTPKDSIFLTTTLRRTGQNKVHRALMTTKTINSSKMENMRNQSRGIGAIYNIRSDL
jgi:hypothetical protein